MFGPSRWDAGAPGQPGARIVAGAVTTALIITLAACGGGASASTSGSSATQSLRVGLVDFSMASVPAQREAAASKTAMEAAGWTVSMQDPNGDASKANSLCTQFVAQKVDVVVVDVYSGSQMTQCLTTASAAKIPVFFIASGLATGIAGAISTSIPTAINQLFVKAVKAASNPQILSLQFSPGLPCLQRQKDEYAQLNAAGISLTGVLTAHEFPIPGQTVDSQAATAAWLNAHPASLGQSLFIWSCTSDAALGSLAALNQASRTATQYTWDLTTQLVPLLKSGKVAATSISDAKKLGSQLVDMINSYRAGNSTPKELQAAALVLDASNIDAYTAANTVS